MESCGENNHLYRALLVSKKDDNNVSTYTSILFCERCGDIIEVQT